ncbi:MAG: sporulation transcription factor Spo0A [Clostridia bacterium]|nr:sporulation transcription factor Spo0A [Clostridia bacterium]
MKDLYEKMTMVLLQSEEESARQNRERFSELGLEVLGVCANGLEAVRVITEQQPDVVVMDSFLPGRSSYDIIEALKEVGYRKQTVFAVLSHVPNDHLARQVMDAGGDLFLLMPLDYQFVRERFVSILRKKRRGEPAPPDENRIELERYVADLMHEVGVPAHIRGYDYIRDSILLSLEDRGMLKAITKELYPTVAKNNNTTASRVERAIRHAIEVAWGRGDIDVLNAIFGFTVKSSKGKPTNGEFISMLTERIRLDRKIAV